MHVCGSAWSVSECVCRCVFPASACVRVSSRKRTQCHTAHTRRAPSTTSTPPVILITPMCEMEAKATDASGDTHRTEHSDVVGEDGVT